MGNKQREKALTQRQTSREFQLELKSLAKIYIGLLLPTVLLLSLIIAYSRDPTKLMDHTALHGKWIELVLIILQGCVDIDSKPLDWTTWLWLGAYGPY